MHLRKTRLAALAGIAALALTACGGSSTTTTSSSAAAPAGSAASGSAAASSAPAAGGDTAGASAAPQGSTAGTLTIWADNLYAPAMKPIAAQFAADNGVTVNVETIAANLQTQFVTASQAGTGPDLVMGAHDWIGNLVQNGAITPIPMTDAQKAAFLPTAIQGVTFNGQIYGVPYAVENVALYRNTTLAPDAPATIEDLVTTGEALKTAGKTSEVLALPIGPNGDAYHMYPLFTSAGGNVFGKTPDGQYDPKQLELGTPEAAAAMTKIAALGETGQNVLKRSISGDNLVSLFTDQKSPYMISGPWNLDAVKKSGVPYAISPVPGFAGMAPASPFIGVQAMYIAAKGQNLALAQEFATNYFPTVEVATQLFQAQHRPPALKAVYEQVAASDPDIKAFIEAGQNGQIMPSITAMALTFDPWGKADAAIIGGADPTSTMTDTAAAIQAQIGG
jgi:arabinogalactan oligomer/maltooligosaccharide transport system substrate-binding protein